jgi:PDZ domain
MKIKEYEKFKFPFLAMVVVVLGLLAMGAWDIPWTPYLGYQVSADYKVVRVAPNSPAAVAGLKAGDRVIEVGGVPTERLYQLSTLRRPEIGEEQSIAVRRDQVRHEFSVTPVPQPLKEKAITWAKTLMALAMVAAGFIVFWRRPSKVSSLFFLFNLFAALSFVAPPYFLSVALRRIVALNFLVFLTMSLAFFLHLTLIFPRPKPSVRETPIELLIYVPIPVMAIFYLALRLFQPEADLLVNVTLRYAFGLLVSMCVGLALAALVHSTWTAGFFDRPRMIATLVSSLVGIVPVVTALLVDSFLPQVRLPGQEYYALLVILVTLSLGWALWEVRPHGESGGLRQAA